MSKIKSGRKVLRYAIVGASLNLVWFLLYLLVTAKGIHPILAVTVFYPLAIYTGYRSHQRYTFQLRSGNLAGATLFRYLFLYFVIYIMNASFLLILPAHLGLPHQWAQLVSIVVCAGFLFIGMQTFVFRQSGKLDTQIRIETISDAS
jgi:putative flippase GtrA